MAVAFIAGTESHTGTSPSTSETSFNWNHAGGAAKGVLIFTMLDDNDESVISSVTYGGVNVPAVSGGYIQLDTGESGATKAWFLGTGVPQGTQNVKVNRASTPTAIYAVSFTVSANMDTEVYTTGIVLVANDATTLAEESVSDGSPGTNSLRFGAIYSGLTSPPAAGANSTLVGGGIDIGQSSMAAVYETTAGQGSRSIGFSSGTTDDVCAAYLAVREPLPTQVGWLTA